MSGFNLMHSGFEEMILIVEFFVPCTLILIQAWYKCWYNCIYLFYFAYPESSSNCNQIYPFCCFEWLAVHLSIYIHISIMKFMEIFMCLCDPWIH